MKKIFRHFSKKRFEIRGIFSVLLLFSCFFMIISGCSDNVLESLSDDDSDKAKIEEANIAIDNRDYEKAVSILSDLNPENDDVKQYLGSAYAGMANFDVFNILKAIEAINDDDTAGSVELVGKAIGMVEDGSFSADELENKLGHLNSSIYAMLGISGGNVTRSANSTAALNLNTQDIISFLQDSNTHISVRLGLVGLAHAVLSIGRIIIEDLGIDRIVLSEAWLKSRYQGRTLELRNTVNIDAYLNDISIDLNLIDHAINTFLTTIGVDEENENEIKEQFDEFIEKIDRNGDLVVSKQELETYLRSL